jgi:transaldolase
MPAATLRAFADHGEIGRPMDADLGDAEETMLRAEAAGIDLPALTAELESEGVRSFCDSYRELLSCIETKVPHGEVTGPPIQSHR